MPDQSRTDNVRQWAQHDRVAAVRETLAARGWTCTVVDGPYGFEVWTSAPSRDVEILVPVDPARGDFESLLRLAEQHLAKTAPVIDVAHLKRQAAWSVETFGPQRLAGVIDHLRKEVDEVAAEPHDLTEWVDVLILAFDGAMRAGHTPEQVIAGIKAKQAKNEARQWPDWRTADPDKAIEHVRGDRLVDLPHVHVGGRVACEQGQPCSHELNL